MNPSDTSVIDLLKQGHDAGAAQEIWERYFQRLVALARTRLRPDSRRVRDEEDIALSAFDSFFRGIEKGRFPRLDDSRDLWQILALLTERKAISAHRRERAGKRGGGAVRGDSVVQDGLDQLRGHEPTPELAAIFTEECRRLFDALNDAELRVVALLKMEGHTNEEIARSLDRVPRSVERKLQAIRKIWREAEAR